MNAEFSWLNALRVFWAITWRCFVIALPLIIIFSIVFGIVGGITGMDKEYIGQVIGIVVNIVFLPIYIIVIKRLFTKGFGKYRLQMVEK